MAKIHFKTLTIPNTGEDVEVHEFSFFAGGNANSIGTLEDSWQLTNNTYNTKHTLVRRSSNCALWYLTKCVQNLCLAHGCL